MKKSIFIPLLLFIFIISFASAGFIVDVTPVDDEIYPGETAVFKIKVKNTGDMQENIKLVFSDDPSWSIITTPIFHQTSYKINPGDETTTTIYVKPDENIDYGVKYTYGFLVESNIDEVTEAVGLEFFLRSPDRPTGYVPSVVMDVDLDSEIDPRYEKDLKVILTNWNPLNISRLVIEVSSVINEKNNQRKVVTLSGLEKKAFNIPIVYDPLQPPTEDYITVKAFIPAKNATIDPVSKSIKVIEYGIIEKDPKTNEEFLKTTYRISFFNNGNVQKSVDFSIPTSIFKQIFTSAEPSGEVVPEAGKRNLAWVFNLAPQESRSIEIIVNYRPLFIIFILVLVATILYYVFRSAVIVKKQALHLMKGDEETSSVKVLLHVKNRTSKPIENIKVLDKVPAIAVLNKEFPVGTMHPEKVIKHDKKGTIVKWTIPTLEAYEERIITYHFRSKLKIIGGVRLPAAMVKYKNKMRKYSKVYSNKTSAE